MTKKTTTKKKEQEVLDLTPNAVVQNENVLDVDVEEIKRLSDEVAALKRSNAGLKSTNTERGKKIKQLEEVLDKKNALIGKLEGEVSKNARTISNLGKENVKLRSDLSILTAELNREKTKSLWERVMERFTH